MKKGLTGKDAVPTCIVPTCTNPASPEFDLCNDCLDTVNGGSNSALFRSVEAIVHNRTRMEVQKFAETILYWRRLAEFRKKAWAHTAQTLQCAIAITHLVRGEQPGPINDEEVKYLEEVGFKVQEKDKTEQ